MKADILFISYNRKQEVKYNLDLMDKYEDVNQIIWVDNGSKDGTTELDISTYKKVKPLFLQENIGIAAYNRGATLSNSDLLIILDDDSHVTNESVKLAKEEFKNDAQLGALGFKIVLPSNGQNVTDDWKVGNVTYFWGCGAAVRTSVWKQLGGYREELFLYGNEYDLSIRIWSIGYKVKYTDKITAFHRVSNMNRTSERLISYSIRNNYIYIKKYFSKKYWNRLFLTDRSIWYIRALLSGSLKAYYEGKRMCKGLHVTPETVSDNIQQFYIHNQRIFETPWKKIIRKIRYKKLFDFTKNV